MSHDHAPHDHSHHAHSHAHSHTPASFHTAFGVGIALNSLFVVVELIAGFYTGSLALVADAIHNLGDVLGLGVAWIGYYFAQKRPSERFTFGFGRLSIFATVFNGAFLVASSVWIVVEAFERFTAPPVEATGLVMLTAGIGIVINAGTALALMRGQHDINIRGAFLHMIGDAGVSAAVVLAAILMAYTGQGWLDPALGILVALFILWTSWPLLLEGLRLAIDGVPQHVDHQKVRDFLASQPYIRGVNDLRIWAISTTDTALAAHITIARGHDPDTVLAELRHHLRESFDFHSVTLQIEYSHDSCL